MDVKYANMFGLRVSRNEVALEFGNFFPGQDNNRTTPDYRDFHTRIVLTSDMVEAMRKSLEQACVAMQQAQKAAEGQPKFNIDTVEVKSA